MLIRDRNRIVTLASPVRLSIVHTLEGIGPCSVATLARVLGVAPDSLYYHLRLLERRGLITKNAEIVDVRGQSIELAYEGNCAAVTRVASSVLRAAQRAFHAGFRPKVRMSGKRRELWVAQRSARLSREQLEAVNRLLNELLATFEHSRDAASKDPLYLVTFALSPYS